MDFIKRLKFYGDSILKGVQLNFENKKYCVNNNLGIPELEKEYNLQIDNCSRFGCTITKGAALLEKALQNGLDCDAVMMDFGGNDCDFNWKEISENPDAEHFPNTPLEHFCKTYKTLVQKLKAKEILPILTTLPPIDPERYFNWFCQNGKLNTENILHWLGDVTAIYRYQEMYSRQIEKIAKEEGCPLIDLRGAFLENRKIRDYLCQDGIHPNTEGQKLIGKQIADFMSSMQSRLAPQAG